MILVDDKTGLLFHVKRVSESLQYSVDFLDLIPAAATLSSIQSIVSTAAGNVTQVLNLSLSSNTVSGTKAQFVGADGTDGEDYEVTLKVTDSIGNTHEDDILIMVRKAGCL